MTRPCPTKMLAKFHQSSGSRLSVPGFISISTSSSLHSGSSASACAVFPPCFVFLAPSFAGCESVSMSKSFVQFASPFFAFVASDLVINALCCFKVLHAARRRVFAPSTSHIAQSKSHPEHECFSAVVCSRVSSSSTFFFSLLCFFAAIFPPFTAHHSTEFRVRKKEEGATHSGIAPLALLKNAVASSSSLRPRTRGDGPKKIRKALCAFPCRIISL